MAQKKKKQHHKKELKKAPLNGIEKGDILSKLELFFEQKARLLFWLSFAAATLFSLLLFDFKVSVGGDDSAYIIRAYDFVHSFKYPSFQGPLYPILLSPFIAIFGISLPVLKLVSFCCMLIAFFFFHKAFQDRVPAIVLYPSLLITASTAFLLTFSGQTYSEALFFMLQAFLFIAVFKFFIPDDSENNLSTLIKQVAIVSAILFLSVITKNIAFAAIIAIVLFLLILKKYKTAGLTVTLFSIFYASWEGLKKIIWTGAKLQAGDQGAILLQKHPYDKTKGMEDFTGFLERFWDNIQIYFSKYIPQFLGIRSFDLGASELGMTSPFLGILVVILFILALFFVFKANKPLLFTGIYLAVFYGLTFIVLQKMWDSGRLIIVYLPFTVLFLISGLYYMARSQKLNWLFAGWLGFIGSIVLFILHKMQKGRESELLKILQAKKATGKEVLAQMLDYKEDLLMLFFYLIVPILLIAFFLGNSKIKKMSITAQEGVAKALRGLTSFVLIIGVGLVFISAFTNISKEANKNTQALKHNIKGDMLYGFTMDWRNYLEMVKYAGKFVPDTQKVACRKPNIAYVYGKRRFSGIYKVPSKNADTLLNRLRAKNIHYVVMANLRKYEAKKTKHTINTIKRYLSPIQKKYPGIFTQIHVIGKDEKATLLKINYEKAK